MSLEIFLVHALPPLCSNPGSVPDDNTSIIHIEHVNNLGRVEENSLAYNLKTSRLEWTCRHAAHYP